MNTMTNLFQRFALLALPLLAFAFSSPSYAAGGAEAAPAAEAHHDGGAAHDGGDAHADGHGGGDAHGGGHGGDHHGTPWKEIGLHAVNLVILLGFLGYLLRNMVPDALKNRSAAIAGEIEDSSARRAAAQERYDELQGRLDSFEKELAQLKAEGEAQAGRERDAVLERGEASAKAIGESAERTIHAAGQRAQQTLRSEAARLAVELAADHIKSDLNDDDNARLTADFIASLKGHGGGDKGATNG